MIKNTPGDRNKTKNHFNLKWKEKYEVTLLLVTYFHTTRKKSLYDAFLPESLSRSYISASLLFLNIRKGFSGGVRAAFQFPKQMKKANHAVEGVGNFRTGIN